MIPCVRNNNNNDDDGTVCHDELVAVLLQRALKWKKQERSGDCTYEIDMDEAIYCFAQ